MSEYAAVWWEHIDAVPLAWLVDAQLRSAWARWVERLQRGPLRRAPGSFGVRQ